MNETAVRRPNRFLADLTQAMRTTAENARQATIDQLKADAEGYVEQLRAHSADEAAGLRQRADTDIEAIHEWSRAEMERIRLETEERVARRQGLLEQELQDYAAGIEVHVDRVQAQVGTFETEMDAFFERLLAETDPSAFATLAAQMPEPPFFDEPTGEALAAELRARREQLLQAESAALPVDESSDDAASGASETAESDEPEAYEPAGESALMVRSDELEENATESANEQAEAAPPRESTRVVVVGLVSVASIASFKRQLGRLPGVRSVGVSSGSDGEFIFTVGHPSEMALGTLIPTLPAFQARVVSEEGDVLNVSAHDPEAEG